MAMDVAYDVVHGCKESRTTGIRQGTGVNEVVYVITYHSAPRILILQIKFLDP